MRVKEKGDALQLQLMKHISSLGGPQQDVFKFSFR